MGPIFAGRGRVISGRLVHRLGSRFGTNTKLLRGVIGPISKPNDCLNRPLTRGGHFVSGDLKGFVYARLVSLRERG